MAFYDAELKMLNNSAAKVSRVALTALAGANPLGGSHVMFVNANEANVNWSSNFH